MRFLVAGVEMVLALIFILASIPVVMRQGIGIVPMSTVLTLLAIGGWLGKKAIANFRSTTPKLPSA